MWRFINICTLLKDAIGPSSVDQAQDLSVHLTKIRTGNRRTSVPELLRQYYWLEHLVTKTLPSYSRVAGEIMDLNPFRSQILLLMSYGDDILTDFIEFRH